MDEFDAGVLGGEAPVDGGAALVAVALPCGDFAAHGGDVGDASIQALTAQGA